MQNQNPDTATQEQNKIVEKTKELCQTMLEQPDVKSIRQRISTFMEDEQARSQYDELITQSQALQQKQQMGMQMSDDEVANFESRREEFINNPVAKDFLDAQEEMQQVQQSVNQYVAKAFELGRVPSEEDMNTGGSCGSGCGCH